ncbi:MAG: hypothetical protein ACREIU_01310, partial [Planctomycetota bacterium]
MAAPDRDGRPRRQGLPRGPLTPGGIPPDPPRGRGLRGWRGWSEGRLALALSAAFAGGLLLVASRHEVGGYDTEADFYGRYLPESRALLEGKPRFLPFNGPGYPLVLGALATFVGDPFAAAKLVSISSLTVAGLLAFLLGRRAIHPEMGLWYQALILLGAARFGILASAEAFFLALVLGVSYLLLRGGTARIVPALLAGLLAGWATLV